MSMNSESTTVSFESDYEVINGLMVEEIIPTNENIIWNPIQGDIVAFISGFILKKLNDKKKISLQDNLLIYSSNKCDLIEIKNQGALKIPSETVESVCQEIEKKITLYKTNLLIATWIHVENQTLKNWKKTKLVKMFTLQCWDRSLNCI